MLALVARLRPGATLEAAQEELSAIASRPHGEQRNRFAPVLSPLREHVSGGFRSAMLVLGGAVALVMLIVCANLSNLLLVRGVSRQKEIAVRAALGAARGRLIRQMLTESVVLAGIGGALGTLLAAAGTRALARMDGNIPMLAEVRLDAVVLAFTLGITLLAGLVFGAAPAFRISTSALHETLKESGRGASPGRRQSWVQDGLVAAEVALACTLLIGAGLLTRSFVRVLDVDMGFEPRNTVALRIDPSTPFPTPSAVDTYYDDALRRVRFAAGVEAAGLTDVLPMGFNRTWPVRPGEIAGSGDLEAFRAFPYVRIVSEGYLEAMGLSLVAGRDFTDRDDRGSRPVIIINETLARSIWPGEDALGRVLVPSDGRNVEREVVGIVRGTRYLAPEQEPGPEMFLPLRQHGDYDAVHLIARGGMRPAELAAAVGEALRPLDPRLPVKDAVVIAHIVARSVSARRLTVTLLVGFAGFALALASIGIYGVISYSVRQRTKEIGIRLALGASARELRTRVLLQTLALAAAGITFGVPAAWVLGRAMQSLLFDVPAADPVTFAAVPAILLVVAAMAGYLPALRASRVDPMRALGGDG
jgi:predicted permease